MRENELDIALYLFNHDCGSDKDKHKVLMQACESGKLKVVKELVEQHNINPKGETCDVPFSGFTNYHNLIYLIVLL